MAEKGKKTKKKPALNSLVNTVLDVFRKNPYKGFNFRQVSSAVGIEDKASRELVKGIIEKLVEAEQVIEIKRGKYQFNPRYLSELTSNTTINGIVDMKNTGKAYVINKELPEDIYIAPNNTNHALNGDTVKVVLFPKRKDKKTEGRIIEIVNRSKKQFVGILQKSKNFAFIVPDDSRITIDIYITAEQAKNIPNGQKVVGIITDWPENANNPFGEIIEVLGEPGKNEVEINSIIAGFDFPLRFNKAAEKEADSIPDKIPENEITNRRDFRKIFTCTIDPEDAKDFDDALSLRKISDKIWEVGVHIADVAHYVKPGGPIDQEAYDRGTSVYMVDRVVPMLPEKLSNGICSLQPRTDKLCFSAVFEMDMNAKIVSEWYGKTIINSDKRYNYEQVQEIIEGAGDEYRDNLMILHQLACKLREERFRRGSIAFTSQEVKFRLDENGKPIEVYIKKQLDSNRLIEDFMLLANRKVAEKVGMKRGSQKVKPFVYRIHDEPNPEKLRVFSEYAAKLGYKLSLQSSKSIADSLNQLFRKIEGRAEENLIENIAVRTMAKAEYSTNNIGHFGLAFNWYTHFTSPIRRYPDLMVHRLLFAYLANHNVTEDPALEDKCKHASEQERKALEAERASTKLKQAEYLMDKIGQDFDGVISGVSKWGVYVELEENKCEGMIPIRSFRDDFYYLDEDNFRIIGNRYHKQYKLGDNIRIKVKRIDLMKKQIDFDLCDNW